MKTLFVSFYLAYIGIKASRTLIVDNAKADWLTHMGSVLVRIGARHGKPESVHPQCMPP